MPIMMTINIVTTGNEYVNMLYHVDTSTVVGEYCGLKA